MRSRGANTPRRRGVLFHRNQIFSRELFCLSASWTLGVCPIRWVSTVFLVQMTLRLFVIVIRILRRAVTKSPPVFQDLEKSRVFLDIVEVRVGLRGVVHTQESRDLPTAPWPASSVSPRRRRASPPPPALTAGRAPPRLRPASAFAVPADSRRAPHSSCPPRSPPAPGRR